MAPHPPKRTNAALIAAARRWRCLVVPRASIPRHARILSNPGAGGNGESRCRVGVQHRLSEGRHADLFGPGSA